LQNFANHRIFERTLRSSLRARARLSERRILILNTVSLTVARSERVRSVLTHASRTEFFILNLVA